MTSTLTPPSEAMNQGARAAIVAAWLMLWSADRAHAAATCANFETIPAGDLIAAVKWTDSQNGLVPPNLGCEHTDVDACEFQNTLATDKRLGAGRRLVVVTADHRYGSGAHDVVTVYACRHREVAAVLRARFEYGINIERADAATIVFTAGLWASADAHCCPSREQRFRYDWIPQSMSYHLSNRKIFPARR